MIMLNFLKSPTLIVKVWITGFKSQNLLIGKISRMGHRIYDQGSTSNLKNLNFNID